ncbi:MAG: hypothetical protein QXP20_02800 [Candidatus Bathyarchaeia archaeon]
MVSEMKEADVQLNSEDLNYLRELLDSGGPSVINPREKDIAKKLSALDLVTLSTIDGAFFVTPHYKILFKILPNLEKEVAVLASH